jgi:HAE1 family hydrophobic/amphiphilic exporter-1
MHPIEACVRNPVKVWVAVILIVLFGMVAWSRMPMQLTPEVQTPMITIETRWPGASPQEVEKEIVREQEEQLKSVENVTKMTSESMDSTGRITLEFEVGIDLDVAVTKVSKRLDQVQAYPEDADKPVIATSGSSDSPIAWFILGSRMRPLEAFLAYQESHPESRELLQPVLTALETGRDGLAELRLRRLVRAHEEQYPGLKELLPAAVDISLERKFAEDTIEALFERVDGVSNANVIGGRDPELQVVVDPEKLAARQLTIQNVRTALRAQNKDTSAGDLWEGKRRWVVRTLGQFRTTKQVEEQLLAVHDGQPVYVRDVAEVHLTHKKPDGFVKRFGNECIAVNVVRRTGANVIAVMAGVQERQKALNAGVLAKKGMVLTQVYDETEYIHSAVGMVRENIFSGAALTMIALMMFLHLNKRTLIFSPLVAISSLMAIYISSWFFLITIVLIIGAGLWFARGALVVSLTIPISIIGTFVALNALGRSLNVISLAGMAFGMGMLVDNAVVVLENIVRHYQAGDSPMDAAIKGTKEVWLAVLATTLTMQAVFLPVIFVKEEAGQLFGDIALAISGANVLSFIISVVVIPVAASRLLTEHGAGGGAEGLATIADEEDGAEYNTRGVTGRFTQVVDLMNSWIQRSMLRKIAIAGSVIAVSVALSWLLWPKMEYLPNGNRNLVFGIVMPPPGYNLDELNNLGQIVEDELKPLWDHDPGDPLPPNYENLPFGPPPIEDFFYVARGRQVFIGMRAQDPLKAGRLIPAVFNVSEKLPGSIAVAFQASLFQQGLQGGRAIDIEVTGPELEKLVQYGGRIIGQVSPLLEPEVVEAMAEYAANPPPPVKGKVPPGPRFATQARPLPSLDLSSPEVHVEPKLVQAREMNVGTDELGYTVNALVDGAYAGDYFQGGDKIDLSIVGRTGTVGSTSHTQEIESLPVAVEGGQLVPIGAIANVSISSGPEQINHRERERAITIQVTPPPQMALEDAINLINTKLLDPMKASEDWDPQYRLTLSGTANKLSDTWLSLRGNLLLATVITYLLMAALYESWIDPFVIILTVPLGAVGGILGLNLLNLYLILLGDMPQSLDVLTMLGFVMLIGTVVNNPILIVDNALQNMRDHGMNPSQAVTQSARTRIRPILMTTCTTVVGLVPLVLFPGAGSELYRGIGSVLLGGMLLSTILALVFIPTMFSLMYDLGDMLAGRRSGSIAAERKETSVVEEAEAVDEEALVTGSSPGIGG